MHCLLICFAKTFISRLLFSLCYSECYHGFYFVPFGILSNHSSVIYTLSSDFFLLKPLLVDYYSVYVTLVIVSIV